MNNIPDSVLEAFPSIRNKVSVRQLASPVPLVPDTTFDIFISDPQCSFALVTTDYADPYSQSHELKSISGSHEFEFDSLQMPFSENRETISILENDNMDVNFFVTVPYKKYRLYYYVANLKPASDNSVGSNIVTAPL